MGPAKIFPVPIWIRNRPGFSLLELIVVLVLIAMVAATVVVRWSGLYQGPAMNSAVAQLEFVDAHMRRYAASHGAECVLSFDLAKNRLGKHYDIRHRTQPIWTKIGHNIRLENFQAAGSKSSSNVVDVIYHGNGTSTSYSLQLVGPGKQKEYLLIAGLTGQVSRLNNEKETDDAMQILKSVP